MRNTKIDPHAVTDGGHRVERRESAYSTDGNTPRVQTALERLQHDDELTEPEFLRMVLHEIQATHPVGGIVLCDHQDGARCPLDETATLSLGMGVRSQGIHGFMRCEQHGLEPRFLPLEIYQETVYCELGVHIDGYDPDVHHADASESLIELLKQWFGAAVMPVLGLDGWSVGGDLAGGVVMVSQGKIWFSIQRGALGSGEVLETLMALERIPHPEMLHFNPRDLAEYGDMPANREAP